MAHVTLGEAARQTGRSKSQISRAIRDGKLSAERSVETASFRIEQSELQRWQDATRVVRATGPASVGEDSATALQRELEAKIEGLRAMAELLREQRDDALSQRDKWEQAFQTAQRLLASPQSSATPAPMTKQPKPRSWWVALVLALLLAVALALLAVDRLAMSVDLGDAWVSRTGPPAPERGYRANGTAERRVKSAARGESC